MAFLRSLTLANSHMIYMAKLVKSRGLKRTTKLVNSKSSCFCWRIRDLAAPVDDKIIEQKKVARIHLAPVDGQHRRHK